MGLGGRTGSVQSLDRFTGEPNRLMSIKIKRLVFLHSSPSPSLSKLFLERETLQTESSSPAHKHFPARWPVVAPPRRSSKLHFFQIFLHIQKSFFAQITNPSLVFQNTFWFGLDLSLKFRNFYLFSSSSFRVRFPWVICGSAVRMGSDSWLFGCVWLGFGAVWVCGFGFVLFVCYGFGFMAVWVCMARIWGCLGVMLLEISLCVHSVHHFLEFFVV